MARAHLGDSITKVVVGAYVVPTTAPESDGTLSWDKTTLVLVQITAQGKRGLGYTYANHATADLIQRELIPEIEGKSPLDIPCLEKAMRDKIRNLGKPGIGSMAISAVDTALWDLKAKILDVSLLDLFGGIRSEVPLYGSGGFTNFSDSQLSEQIEGWLGQGISRVKIKIGRDLKRDLERIKRAREQIGPENELYVDANGAYAVKEALSVAARFREFDVKWFEEPVAFDNPEGLRFIRERLSPEIELASGEYGYELIDFKNTIDHQAVDVLQADATRCGGFSGFFRVASLARSSHLPLSSHCAPALHAALGCSIGEIRHLEYFSDHARIEAMFFDGLPAVQAGATMIDRSRPGLGFEIKLKDLEKLAA